MRGKISAAKLLGLIVLILSAQLWSDEWMRPEPVSFHCRGFSYVAEIFPPKSRQNPGGKPVCYFYKMDYPGLEWKIGAHLVWKGSLVNPVMPYQAVISMDGLLVTLNDYGQAGFNNAVTIYDRGGKVSRSYSLDELITPEDR